MENVHDTSNVNILKNESTLFGTLFRVLGFLNAKDLCRAASVCKVWREAVRKERDRRGPVFLLSPFPTSDEPVISYSKVRPKVVLLFKEYNIFDKHNWKGIESQFQKIVSERHNVVTVPCAYITAHENNLYEPKSSLISLLLPENTRLRAKSITHGIDEILGLEFEDLALEIVEALFPLYQENTCNIMFLYRQTDYKTSLDDINEQIKMLSYQVCNYLMQRYNSGTLWGMSLKVFDNKEERRWTNSDCRSHDRMVITNVSLSGPGLQSWSVIVQRTFSELEIEEQLRKAQLRIHLNNQSLALMCAPVEDYDYHEEHQRVNETFTTIFKKVFPNIPLTSLFNFKDHFQFGINLSSNDVYPPVPFWNDRLVTYLILTYE